MVAFFISTDKHYLTFSHNLLGCPELQLWTDNPSCIDGITVNQNDSSVTVSSLDSCTISINGLFGYDLYHNHVFGNSATFESVPVNYLVSASKHNRLVYIAPLYLQNENVSGSHYIHADEVSIGNSVSSDKPYGDFVVGQDASLIINSSNSISIEDGFAIELGGSFQILNRLTVDQCCANLCEFTTNTRNR